jgi:hypothetical protein
MTRMNPGQIEEMWDLWIEKWNKDLIDFTFLIPSIPLIPESLNFIIFQEDPCLLIQTKTRC